ncbi:MAG TPA: PKD domain-containing protein [Emticicia sp.]
MKKILHFFSLLFIVVGCQHKKNEIPPIPDASFTVSIDTDNIATFRFTVNTNDVYTFDFGDGERVNFVENYTADKELIEYNHIYRKNGNFTASLTLYTKDGKNQSQKVVEAKYGNVADFSYEVLANGRLKLKNLSQNARQGHKWYIKDASFSGSEYFYSTEQDPIVDIDLNGKYQIILEVPGQYNNSIKQDTVHIKNAGQQMTFSGLYQGKMLDVPLDESPFRYTGRIGGGIMESLGLHQRLWDNTGSREILVLLKLSTFPNQNSMFTEETKKEGVYATVKKLLTKENDPDIIEVTEENLNLNFYNFKDFFFPKAFWVRYKIKNEQLDGELKVRILIQSLWYKVE